MTTEPFMVFEGASGARVEVRDLSSPYAYKNIYHVRLSISATFAGCDERFCRTLEKLGVFEEELCRTREELLASFRETMLPYLLREDFPQRLLEAKARETVKAFGYGDGQ